MSKVLPAASPAAEAALLLFSDLELRDEIQQAVLDSGYVQPTPIQAQIIPHVLAGRDVLAQSQTGSGKTAAFALPILSKIEVPTRRQPQVLVLAPTRELAMQVSASFQQYGRNLAGLNIATIYGGQDYEVQFRQLNRQPQIVVGTPGRVIDHVNRGRLDLSGIDCLVLDEADEMLNMGFLEDVQFVLEKMPNGRQITLFSATLPPAIREIAEQYLRDPVHVTIKQKTMTAESIQQRAVFVGVSDKLDVLARFLEMETTDGVIVFTKTKESTITVAEYLVEHGYKATALNGDMPQKVRERAIQQLKSGYLDIVVATDVAARGLDVPRISHVFNFDLPHDSESYIHRIGRTGRAGRSGHAIVFLTGGQKSKLRLIERATKQPIEVVERPTAKQINKRRVERFKSRIREAISNQDLAIFQHMVQELVQETPEVSLEQVGAALAQMLQNGRPFLLEDRPTGRRHREDSYDRDDRNSRASRSERPPRRDRAEGRDQHDRGDRRPKSDRASFNERPAKGFRANAPAKGKESRKATSRSAPPSNDMNRYRVEIGWDDGIKPGTLVGAIANEAGLDGRDIGTINIQDRHSFVDLPKSLPLDVVESLGMTKIRGKSLRLSPVIGKPKGPGRSDYSKD
ncbi:MAG: DEAD/DEAH box helicase [Planctomycetaceae bacterium]|nr:DEAD/DEAH box helicase [Planctomycetaceae bacterium]